jgi:hypothetical protein
MVAKRRQSSVKLDNPTQAVTPARQGTAAPIPAMPPSTQSNSPDERVGTTRTIIRAPRVASRSIEPSLLEQAEGLRDTILKSRLCHPDPWSYTPRTRSWGLKAQHIIDDIAEGKDTETCRRAYEALAAEVGSDPEFQVARRQF